MLRILLAVGLLLATCVVDAFTGRSPTTPISVEHSLGNPIATAIFVLLGALLIYFAQQCWRIGWRFLAMLAGVLFCMVSAVAVTKPESQLHTLLFTVFVALGMFWLIIYALLDGQRSIVVLVVSIILGAFAITLIIGVVDAIGYTSAYDTWPLGLFQRGLLVAFCLLALRHPNQTAQQDIVPNP